MTLCPAGHESAADDYCDECGAAIGSPSAAPPATVALPCPVCGEPHVGRYCESCGHDTTLPATVDPSAPPAQGWTALVRVDRAWFDEVRAESGPDVAELEFPGHCPERRFALTGPRLSIGRASRSRGTNPDIDLTGPPLDPGVSAMHAVLLERDDGGWEVVDLESANGTRVGAQPPITPHRPVPLRSGDEIRLGAWTTITVSAG